MQDEFIRDNGFPADDPRCYACIPSRTRQSIDAWANSARPVGGFLLAILSNNLLAAVNQGDLENLRAIPAIVAYLYNRVPLACWGSESSVHEWPMIIGVRRLS